MRSITAHLTETRLETSIGIHHLPNEICVSYSGFEVEKYGKENSIYLTETEATQLAYRLLTLTKKHDGE